MSCMSFKKKVVTGIGEQVWLAQFNISTLKNRESLKITRRPKREKSNLCPLTDFYRRTL